MAASCSNTGNCATCAATATKEMTLNFWEEFPCKKCILLIIVAYADLSILLEHITDVNSVNITKKVLFFS